MVIKISPSYVDLEGWHELPAGQTSLFVNIHILVHHGAVTNDQQLEPQEPARWPGALNSSRNTANCPQKAPSTTQSTVTLDYSAQEPKRDSEGATSEGNTEARGHTTNEDDDAALVASFFSGDIQEQQRVKDSLYMDPWYPMNRHEVLDEVTKLFPMGTGRVDETGGMGENGSVDEGCGGENSSISGRPAVNNVGRRRTSLSPRVIHH